MSSATLSHALGERLRERLTGCGSTLYALTWKQQATPSGLPFSLLRGSVHRTSDTGSTGAQSGWPTPMVINSTSDKAQNHRPTAGPQRGGPSYGLQDVALMVSGWPTPAAMDAISNAESPASKASRGSGGTNLPTVVQTAGWPSPTANDALKLGRITPRDQAICLVAAAQMSGWPTPSAKVTAGGEYADPAKAIARAMGPHANDLRDFVQMTATGWATPRAEDAETTGMSGKRLTAGHLPDNLPSQATLLTGWATPATRDYRTPNHKAYADRGGAAKGEQLNNQVAHVVPGASLNGTPQSPVYQTGETVSGSPAPMGGYGLLAPHFSLWLQGFPAAWLSHAPADNRSVVKRAKKSAG